MHDTSMSWVQTYTQVPAAGIGQADFVIAEAGDAPARVLVDNIGLVSLFLSFSSENVKDAAPTTDTYRLRPGQNEPFVLTAGQKLYANGAGGGGRVSVAVNKAFPIGKNHR